jgi:gamma-glutamylputrescine oxidase
VGFNSGLGMERSYYAATANPFAPAPIFEGEHEADLVVVGAGYTGLSVALSAALAGLSVIVLEAGRVGWGASGRNGGQIIPGWRKGAAELVKLYGKARARLLFDIALRARECMLAHLGLNDIRCDLTVNGHLLAAAKPSDLAWMREEAAVLADVMGYPHVRVLDRDEAAAHVSSPAFHGGLLDSQGGHLHPLNYALGLADAARRRGVRVFENSQAVFETAPKRATARTARGRVRARYGMLACDALLGAIEPRIAGRIMPVANYIAVTEPLNALPIANDLAVSDSRFVVNYFRLSADRRLIFGGGERYTPRQPADIQAFVRPHIERIFPQLAGVRIDHAWGGMVSVTMTRLPHIGRMGDVFFAHGYSGQGVVLPAIVGEAVVEAITGDGDLLETLASIAPPEFPGGAALRSPLYVLGMLWYALRDRL